MPAAEGGRVLRETAAIMACCAAIACDVSDPAQYTPDSGAALCAPLFAEGETIYADLSCAQPTCTPTVLQDKCALAIRITGCANHEINAAIGADGAPIFEPSETAGSCVAV